MRKFLIQLIEQLHRKIFGHEMSSTMREFLNNLSWSFFGVMFSAVILFAVNVTAGRILGPTGYGNYSLVFSVATFSAVFIALGFDSTSLKFVSSTSDQALIKKLVSNPLIAVSLLSLVYLALGLLLKNQLAQWLKTSSFLIIFALIYSVIYTFRTLTDGLTKALRFFKRQAKIKIIESLTVLSLFSLFFFVLGRNFYYYYVLALMMAAVVAVGLYLFPLRHLISHWSQEAFSLTKNYQKITVLVGLIGISIGTIDKFFVARYLGPAQLGFYSAYLITSTAVISQIVILSNNVFFPMINTVSNKRQIMAKIDQLAKYLVLPVMLFSAIVSFLVLKIFGSAYNINWIYIFLISIIAFCQIVIGFYGSIIASSENFFRFNAKIYYFKPLFIAGLYGMAFVSGMFNLYTIFLIVISSYVYDFLSAKVSIKVIKNE